MEISNDILINLIKNQTNTPIIKGYQMVEHTITGSDPEDGGTDYEMVIKNIEENRYYLLGYCDWDVQNEEIDTNVLEVYPVEKMVIVYEQKT